MIRLRLGDKLLVGLTDVNMRRLGEGKPATVPTLLVPGETHPAEVVIFHATRETLLEIARVYGLDEAAMLDALGEG